MCAPSPWLKGNGNTDVLGTPSAGLAIELGFVDQSLGLDPDELDAVRKEQIQVLPFLFTGDRGER